MACRVAGAALVLPGDAGDAGGTSLAVLVAASGARFARRRAGRGHELARSTVVACRVAGATLVLPCGAGDARGARRAALVLPRIAVLARHVGHRPGRRVLARGAILAFARMPASRGVLPSRTRATRMPASRGVLPRRTDLTLVHGAPGVLVLPRGAGAAMVVAASVLVLTCA